MRLRMRLPPVEPSVYARPPECCPRCGNPTFHSRGSKGKPIRDMRLDGVIVRRIQCPQCGKTLRLYPQGITARDQSERVRGLSVLLWLHKLTLLVDIVAQLEQLRESARLDAAGQAKVAQALADVLELEELILGRCPGSQARLEALARRYEQTPLPRKGHRAPPFARLKLLTMDLAANWPRLTFTESRRDVQGRRFVPATNNVSEQQIGMNIKERYRTMRGYKSETSLRRVVTLTAYLRDAHDDQALIRALAA